MSDNGNAPMFDTAKQLRFLKAFAVCGVVTHAAKTAGINRSSHYEWLKRDPNYKPAWDEARRMANDNLEAEARRRAVDGVRKAVVQKGEVVFAWYDSAGEIVAEDEAWDAKAKAAKPGYRRGPVYEHAYSDRLLEILLRAAKPDKYREKKEITHKGEMEVRMESKDEKLARVQEALALVRGKQVKLTPSKENLNWDASSN